MRTKYKRCAAPGCKNLATPHPRSGTPRKTCSPRCGAARQRQQNREAWASLTPDEKASIRETQKVKKEQKRRAQGIEPRIFRVASGQ